MSENAVEDGTATTGATPTGAVKRVRKPRKPTLDAAAAGAVDLARAAAEEVADEGTVGEHLGAVPEGDRIVSHTFACLLPGEDALQPPAWLPWAERLAPGDVGPHDTLPRKEHDPLLEQGFEETGDEDLDRVALHELGLGRERVLSPLGRDEAATRWYEGDRGPRTEIAENAKAQCSTCGFFLALAGSLRQVFGACANEWSPEDGRVVSADHGCGAHSETDVDVTPEEPAATVVDDLSPEAYEVVETGTPRRDRRR